MNYYITVLNRFNVWYGFYQLMIEFSEGNQRHSDLSGCVNHGDLSRLYTSCCTMHAGILMQP